MFTASHLKAFGRYEYFPICNSCVEGDFSLKKKESSISILLMLKVKGVAILIVC